MIAILYKRYETFVIILEFDSCGEFYGEWAKIVAAHILTCIFAGFFLGNQLRTVYGTFGTLLVEDVDNAHTETQFLVHVPVDTAESLPVTIEIECLLKVGIGLAEVTEAQPSVQVLGDVILRVQLNEYLWNLLHYHVVSIYAHSLAVVERYACIVVLIHWLLIGEEGVHVEVLEWIDLGRGGPTQSLDVVDEQHGLALCCSWLGKILLVDIVRL